MTVATQTQRNLAIKFMRDSNELVWCYYSLFVALVGWLFIHKLNICSSSNGILNNLNSIIDCGRLVGVTCTEVLSTMLPFVATFAQ